MSPKDPGIDRFSSKNKPSLLLQSRDGLIAKFFCMRCNFSKQATTALPEPKLILLLFFQFFLVRLDDICRQMLRDNFVMIEFHGEVSAPTGE